MRDGRTHNDGEGDGRKTALRWFSTTAARQRRPCVAGVSVSALFEGMASTFFDGSRSVLVHA
jgi:hypothetical protein